jgi:MFS family permease
MIIIISVAPQMWLTVPGLMAGRFLLGFGAAMCCVCSSVFMAESVPAWKLGTVGTAVNTGIVTALVVSSIIQGCTLPALDDH